MVDDDELVNPIVASPPLDQISADVGVKTEVSTPVIGKGVEEVVEGGSGGDVRGEEVASGFEVENGGGDGGGGGERIASGEPVTVSGFEVESDEFDGDVSRKEVASVEEVITSGFEVKNDGGERGEGIASGFEVKSDRIDGDETRKELTGVETVIRSEFDVKSDGIDGDEGPKEVMSVEPVITSGFDVKSEGIDGDEGHNEVTRSECGVQSDGIDENASVEKVMNVETVTRSENGGDNKEKGEGVVSVEEVKMEEFSPVNEELVAKNDGVGGEESEKEVAGVELEVKNDDVAVVGEQLEVKKGEIDGNESVEQVKTDELTVVRDESEVKKGETDGDSREEDAEQVKTDDFTVVIHELEVKNNDEVDRDGSGKEVASVEMEVKNDEVDGEESKPAIEEVEGKTEDKVKTEEIRANEDDVNEEEKDLEGEKVENDEEEKEVKEMEEEEDVGEEDVEEMEDDDKKETEMDVEMESGSSGGKRKRGRNAKASPVKARGKKANGEDVCFICLDGGALVLCDRRGCSKAYHPVCVDHDEEFFKTKGRWNCGWHQCNNCGKNAQFMCLTCTFSLCKGCCKDSAVFCVRGNKGFCESCMKSILMIEKGEQNEMGNAAFNDKSSWEYLFKDYWLEQKRKLCISSDELFKAKNPWINSDTTNKEHDIEGDDVNDDEETESDSSHGQSKAADSKRKRAERKSKSENSDSDSSPEKDATPVKRKSRGRPPKSQAKEVNSDSEHSPGNRVTGKKRGRKPKKLVKCPSLEGHSSAVGNRRRSTEGNVEWASTELLDFVKHMKDGDTSVLSQFDVQALLLEYIKRNKLRDPRRQSQIICDPMLQKMFGKSRVGHFEMLKLLESHFLVVEDIQADENHASVDDTGLDADDNYDLMDVGKSKGKKSRKRGEERELQTNLDDYAAIDMHNINLIYLRRNLIEALIENTETFHEKVVGAFVRIRISGNQKQDIYRLVQVIGTTKAAESYKVGKKTTNFMLEILNLNKTENISIDVISNQEFTEDECKRLRQSIKCGLLSRMTVGDILEKARELQEVRVNDWLEAEIVKLSHLRDRASEKGRKKELRLCVEKLQLLKSPEERQRRIEQIPKVNDDPKMDPNCESEEEEEIETDNSREVNIRARRGRDQSSSWNPNPRPPNRSWDSNRDSSIKGYSTPQTTTDHPRNNGVSLNSWDKPRPTPDISPMTPPPAPSPTQTDPKINESEKIWHYRDPTGKVQGPFSLTQLRKWSNTGYFPADLRTWRTSQVEDDAILLTDILAGKLDTTPVTNRNAPPVLDTSKFTGSGSHGTSNLPSPTPSSSVAASKWSSPSNSYRSNNQFRGGNERLPSPTPTSPTPNSQPNMAVKSALLNTQRIPSQSTPLGPNQPYVGQVNPGQNPTVYGQTWHNRPNPVPPQLPQSQWTGGPVAGYPPMGGNIPIPSQNTWGTKTNMPWANQQQPANPNTGWSMPPPPPQPPQPSGFRPSGSGQVPLPGQATMPLNNPNTGWAGSGRVGPPGNRGAQWNNRQSQRGVCKFHESGHCRKGSACDYLHT